MSSEIQVHDKETGTKERRERQIREKRRETRRQAEGAVRLEFSNPLPVNIQGRLIDISPSGFRVEHGCTSLATGQVVKFSHSAASGQARVMWNRILDTRVETGFLIVAS